MKFLVLLLMLLTRIAAAQTLVLETSDSHSGYDQLAGFLRRADGMRNEFLAKNPNGRVVLIVNGDYGGASRFSNERDWVGMQALKTLAERMDVLYIIGNHDGFDWGPKQGGNRLMEKQLIFLAQNGVKVFESNIQFAPRMSRYVVDHYDLISASGKRLRFLGFGLDSFFAKTNYDAAARPHLVQTVKGSLPVAKASLKKALSDGVSDVVLFQHDDFVNVRDLVTQLSPELSKMKLPVAFAAHDHEVYAGKVGETLLIDSRSNFDFSAVELDENNQVSDHHFYSALSEISTAKPSRAIEDMAKAVEAKLAHDFRASTVVVAQTGGFKETKLDLTHGQTLLGQALTECLRLWATATSHSDLPVISFFNSSSYRRDVPIAPGPLTVGDLEAVYPFTQDAELFEATGFEIQSLYRALRQWADVHSHTYSPQISRNLHADASLQLDFEGHSLGSNQKFILAMDPWLSINGYHIDEFQNFLDTHPPIDHAAGSDVFKRFGAQAFSRLSPPKADAACPILLHGNAPAR